MKRHNRDGPALLGEVKPLPELSAAAVISRLADGARLIDTRPRAKYQRNTPAHSLHLPDGNTLETWAGGLLDPQRDYLLLATADRVEALRRQLWMVGVAGVTGFMESASGLPNDRARTFPAAELGAHADALILDVRSKNEHVQGAVPGSQQLHAGRLATHLDRLPRDREIVVHCQSGARSAAAASLLRAEGFQVSELAGGYEAWAAHQGAPS